MTRLYQYPSQSFYDPGSIGDGAAEPADASTEWWMPFGEPVRRLPAAMFVAAFVASGEMPGDPTTIGDAERVKIDEWWQPWPEQIWPKPALHAAQQQDIALDWGTIGDPETVKIEDWHVAWPDQTYGLPPVVHLLPAEILDHGSLGDAGGAPAADTSTEWFVPFAEPVLARFAYPYESYFDEPLRSPVAAVGYGRRIYRDRDVDDTLPRRRMTLDELRRLREEAEAETPPKTTAEVTTRIRRKSAAATSTAITTVTTEPATRRVEIVNAEAAVKAALSAPRKPAEPKPAEPYDETDDEETLVMLLLEIA